MFYCCKKTYILFRVDDAVKKAKAASELPADELFTDIYDFGPPKFVRYPDLINSKTF